MNADFGATNTAEEAPRLIGGSSCDGPFGQRRCWLASHSCRSRRHRLPRSRSVHIPDVPWTLKHKEGCFVVASEIAGELGHGVHFSPVLEYRAGAEDVGHAQQVSPYSAGVIHCRQHVHEHFRSQVRLARTVISVGNVWARRNSKKQNFR